MHLQIITTGGTFDKIYFDALSEFSIGDPAAETILHSINPNLSWEVTSLLRKDSLELTDADRELIYQTVADSSAEHLVITHGTDTMILTAQQLKGIPGKTVILTGAMLPALCKQTDAEFNLGGAVALAQTLPHGVYLFMNGRVYDPDKVAKNRAEKQFQDA
ncbi:asparaginase [Nitrincola sp. A-D6]|uniref:asparaginase domain-containing protein n=1 Tax=Nitrincola sp. A-D6 TaxID=1545442 RepID=UPI00051F9EEA|nr:asparaginase domain-containing protein [Nitrincola sp. A-D6]KGK41019.1 asparaginase [Nitrincola sp. A-D6]